MDERVEPRGARAPRERASRRCSPPSAATRTRPTGFDDADRGRAIEALAARRARAWRSARPGSTSTATAPRARTRSAPSRRRSRSRARTRQAARHPHPRRGGRTTTVADCFDAGREADGVDGDPALLLGARSGSTSAAERGWYCLVRRQRHLPEGRATCARRRARARRPPAGRDRRARSSRRSSCAEAEPAGQRRPTRPSVVAEARGDRLRASSSAIVESAERGERCSVWSARLGQNFLVDPNLLEAIVARRGARSRRRRARGRRRGGGADRAPRARGPRHVHVVELDRALRRAARAGRAPSTRTSTSSGATR